MERNGRLRTLLFAIVALSAALYLYRRSEIRPQQEGRIIVGEVGQSDGDVAYFSALYVGAPNQVLTKTPGHIHIGDEISIGSGSARLVFENGLEANLEESSRLIVRPGRDASEPFALELKAGTLALVKRDLRQPRVRVEVDGKSLELGPDPIHAGAFAADRLLTNPKAAELAATLDETALSADDSSSESAATDHKTERAPVAAGASAPGNTNSPGAETAAKGVMSNRDIRRAMNAQAGFFKRCALAYLERQRKSGADANGLIAILMNFTVLPSGHAIDAKAADASTDEKLGRCIAEVIERVPFRRFDGAPIAVADYAITIE